MNIIGTIYHSTATHLPNSKGEVTDRVAFEAANQKTYRVAAKRLDEIKSKKAPEYSFFSWRWVPIRLASPDRAFSETILLNVSSLSKRFGISRSQIWQWRKAGTLERELQQLLLEKNIQREEAPPHQFDIENLPLNDLPYDICIPSKKAFDQFRKDLEEHPLIFQGEEQIKLFREKIDGFQFTASCCDTPNKPDKIETYLHLKRKNKQYPSGTSKKQKLALTLSTGEIVARKPFCAKGPSLVAMKEEAERMEQLRDVEGIAHIKNYGSYKDKKKRQRFEIFEDYFNLGDLFLFESPARQILRKDQIDEIFRQALFTLDELHQKGIVHQDIKPENILLKVDKQGNLKLAIADFEGDGWTPQYLAPEKARSLKKEFNEEENKQQDIWSLGISFCSFFFPLNDPARPQINWYWDLRLSEEEILQQIDNLNQKDQNRFFPEPNPMNQKYLLWKMLQINPSQRITAAEAKGWLETHQLKEQLQKKNSQIMQRSKQKFRRQSLPTISEESSI